ncbi:Hypothetical protein A7982_11942 [Minicystis rosea]|nr:Hypothetical protein A7982_11942 [Minicystis rosea]
MRSKLVLLAAVLGVAGCGIGSEPSTRIDETGEAPSSGDPGSRAQGAYVFTMIQEDPFACHLAGHTAAVGQVSDKERGQVIADTVGGTRVSCTVSGANGFHVHGEIDDSNNTGNTFELDIPSLTSDALENAPVEGTMVISAPWTAGVPYSGACKFHFGSAPPQGVATGRAWVTFTCPAMSDGASSTCPIQIGRAIFENCEGS